MRCMLLHRHDKLVDIWFGRLKAGISIPSQLRAYSKQQILKVREIYSILTTRIFASS